MAARIINLLVKSPSEGKKKKKIFDQEVGLLETFLESVPSTLILTIVFIMAKHGPGENMNNIWSNLIVFLQVLIVTFCTE